jgi:uncharacterized protein (TIGR04255 family)
MGAFFQPPIGFNVAERAHFWSIFRDQFPHLQEQSPVAEIREEFDSDSAGTSPRVRWQLGQMSPSPRLWAKSKDGKHTLQIQQDALLVNWERELANREQYRPYESRRKDFAEKINALDHFLRDKQLGTVQATSCVTTYINHIEYEPANEYAPLLQRLLTVWRNETSDGWLPRMEHAGLQMTFAMLDQQGRLHIQIVPGVRHRDNRHILRLDLTARGAPRDQSIEAVLDWIDLGHEWIVRGFASLTTPEMHQQWGRTR